MKKQVLFVLTGLLLSLFLPFCVAAETSATDAVSAPAVPAKQDSVFRVLDISERTYDNGPSIAVVLSEPLDTKLRHDDHLRISDSREMLKSAWVLSDDGKTLYFPHVEPETEYSVSVMETLTSATGRELGERITRSVTTRQITPIISFASEGFLLPARLTKGLPVVTVNITSVEMEFFRLNEQGLLNFIYWNDTTRETDYYDLAEVKKYGEVVFSGRFDLDVPRNRRTVYHIPVEDIEALRQPGVYMAVMRQPGQYSYEYQTTYFMVTDIGLHVRAYESESLIFTSSLKTGESLAGVNISLYDEKGNVLEKGATDDQGMFRVSRKLPEKARLLTASWQDQITVLPMGLPALDLSEFDLGSRKYQAHEIFAYSPRDIYRPGETMTVSALLRSYDGKPLDGVLPLKAKLTRPDGKEARVFTWRPKTLAHNVVYYQTSIKIPKDAQTGKWLLRIQDNPAAANPNTVFAFQVEDFLPERLKLDLKVLPEFPGLTDALSVDVSGQYLYGAAAAGNDISTKVSVRARRELFDTLKGFEFGDIKDAEFKDYWDMDDAKLDKTGNAKLEIPARWSEIFSPLQVRVSVDLFESGGRPVTRSIRHTIWPADKLVGIRPLFADETTDAGPVRFEIVRTDQSGKLLPAENLLVQIIKEDRDYYWEYSDSTGWDYKYTEKTYGFQTDTLNLEAGHATPYTLHLQDGQYVLAIEDPETKRISSFRFRVGDWWMYANTADAARPDKVALKLDKPAYRPGDVIQLTVMPPHDGQAIIAVESGKPLWTRRISVAGTGTVVEIPILAGWDSHDIYISAVVFRPANAEEKITPNRSVGMIHLPLDRSERKLELEVEAPEKVRPQEAMTVKLKTLSPAPNPESPVFVTLAAVDVGILNITDFKTPDPFTFFFERRRFDVDAYDVYGKVIENMDGNMAALRFGGDADSTGGKPPENNVKLLSLFQGPVSFDENGQAEVSFTLPDFNGKIRLMAVAFDTARFGSAEREVTVAAPVVTQLAMPRFLAPGDASFFTLDVHNLSGQDQNITVSLKADGPVELKEGERTVPLKDTEKTTLRFPVTVPGTDGTSKIVMELAGSDFRQTRDWSIGVRPGYPAIARKVFAVVSQNETWTLPPELVADMIPGTVVADMKISPYLILDFRNAMNGLLAYPYGCLEQTTSRAMPLLIATPETIALYNLPAITPEDRMDRLNKAVSRLVSMQLASGGFGLWSRNSEEESWLTVYAAEFLLAARQIGVSIPDEMVDKALNRLEEYVKGEPPLPQYMKNENRDHLRFAVQSYAAYVLSIVNRAPLGTIRTLYDASFEKVRTGLPLVYMGIALRNMGDTRRSADAFKLATGKRATEYNWWGDYGSAVRDLSLMTALMIENKADGADEFENLLNDLQESLRQRSWLSTQEKYAVFKAGMALNQQKGKPWKGKLVKATHQVKVAGTQTVLEQIIDKKGPYLESPGVEDIQKGVSFVSDTQDRLYVSAVVNGYTQTPPPKDDSKITIKREMFDLKGKLVTASEFKVGELLLVHLSISAKERIPDALVVDLLPAGFEAENQNLKHSFSMEDLKIDDKSIFSLREQADVLHEEYRDDRYVAAVRLNDYQVTHLFYLARVVSPGTFTVPPPFVESMYRPEIRGIGDTPKPVTIINKNR